LAWPCRRYRGRCSGPSYFAFQSHLDRETTPRMAVGWAFHRRRGHAGVEAEAPEQPHGAAVMGLVFGFVWFIRKLAGPGRWPLLTLRWERGAERPQWRSSPTSCLALPDRAGWRRRVKSVHALRGRDLLLERDSNRMVRNRRTLQRSTKAEPLRVAAAARTERSRRVPTRSRPWGNAWARSAGWPSWPWAILGLLTWAPIIAARLRRLARAVH